jgi:hypothetical protein
MQVRLSDPSKGYIDDEKALRVSTRFVVLQLHVHFASVHISLAMFAVCLPQNVREHCAAVLMDDLLGKTQRRQLDGT